LVAHSDPVTSYACDDRLLICWCRLLFFLLTERRSKRDRSKENPDNDQQSVPHHLRLPEWKQLRYVKSLALRADFSLYGILCGVMMAAVLTFVFAIPANNDHWRVEITKRGGGDW
jgi:hypothetical protein